MTSQPIRFSYEDSLGLWRLGRLVRLELDAWVDNLVLLFRDLTHLQELDITLGYQNGDLNMVMHMRNLKSLRVKGSLDDIRPLVAVTQLVSLAISAWGLTDVSVLHHLTRLEELDLSRCNIVDISSLSSLSSFRELRLDETGVVDLQPLACLSSLRLLSLVRCAVRDLTPLVALASTLKHLDVSGCTLTYVRSLRTLEQLETLCMDRTTWSFSATEPDVSRTLEQLRQLRHFDGRVITLVTGTHTRLKMTSLRQLSNLVQLELTGDAVPKDPPPAFVLPSLVYLRVEWNYIRMDDLPLATVVHPLHAGAPGSPAPGCCRRRHLLAETRHHRNGHPLSPTAAPIHDLQPLTHLPKLRDLDLSSTSLAHLQPIQHLHQLRYVDLSSTDVTDVTPLQGLRFLETIKLRDTEITRFEPGLFCNNLRELVLPEHIDCRPIHQRAPQLRKLLHPDRNCLWTTHESDPTMD